MYFPSTKLIMTNHRKIQLEVAHFFFRTTKISIRSHFTTELNEQSSRILFRHVFTAQSMQKAIHKNYVILLRWMKILFLNEVQHFIAGINEIWIIYYFWCIHIPTIQFITEIFLISEHHKLIYFFYSLVRTKKEDSLYQIYFFKPEKHFGIVSEFSTENWPLLPANHFTNE